MLAAVAPACRTREKADDANAVFARESLELLLRRDVDRLRARFSPELRRLAPPEVLAKVLAEIPDGVPAEATLVRHRSTTSPEGRSETITWQYRYPATYLLGRVRLDVSGPRPLITALNLQRIADSLERVNAFRIEGRTWRHYAMLAAALLVPAFVVVTLVACLRTPGLKRKWLWLPLIALGIGRLQINWTTGDVRGRLTRVQILSGGVFAENVYAPWILSVSLPVGAIAFWLLARRPRAVKETESATE